MKTVSKRIKVAGWVEYDNAAFLANESAEWTYQRPEGDITVFARSANDALVTIQAHGFTNLDPKKLKQTSGRLTDYLKRSEIK